MRDREHDIMMTETHLDRLTVDLQDILTWIVEHKEQRPVGGVFGDEILNSLLELSFREKLTLSKVVMLCDIR